jgi:hypothetical protein
MDTLWIHSVDTLWILYGYSMRAWVSAGIYRVLYVWVGLTYCCWFKLLVRVSEILTIPDRACFLMMHLISSTVLFRWRKYNATPFKCSCQDIHT